jgi:hypothetical protein
VGNDDTPVGPHRPTGHEFGPPIVERLVNGTELRVSRCADAHGKPAIIRETQGAMSLQGSQAAHGRDSMPQKFLQLVGCRDPKASSRQSPKLTAASRRPSQRSGG